MQLNRPSHRRVGLSLAIAVIGAASGLAALAAVGDVAEYSLAGSNGPNGVTAGPDGNLWVTQGSDPHILKVTPAGVVTSYDTGASGGSVSITTGPD